MHLIPYQNLDTQAYRDPTHFPEGQIIIQSLLYDYLGNLKVMGGVHIILFDCNSPLSDILCIWWNCSFCSPKTHNLLDCTITWRITSSFSLSVKSRNISIFISNIVEHNFATSYAPKLSQWPHSKRNNCRLLRSHEWTWILSLLIWQNAVGLV